MPGDFHFSTEVRVRLSETDAFGIVFHGYFFTYFDVARMDYLRNAGILAEAPSLSRMAAPIAHASAEFRSPARFDDVLVVYARVAEIGRTSFTFEFKVVHRRENRLVAEGRTVQVVIDEKTWKPVPVPEAFRTHVRQFEGAGLVERGGKG